MVAFVLIRNYCLQEMVLRSSAFSSSLSATLFLYMGNLIGFDDVLLPICCFARWTKFLCQNVRLAILFGILLSQWNLAFRISRTTSFRFDLNLTQWYADIPDSAFEYKRWRCLSCLINLWILTLIQDVQDE